MLWDLEIKKKLKTHIFPQGKKGRPISHFSHFGMHDGPLNFFRLPDLKEIPRPNFQFFNIRVTYFLLSSLESSVSKKGISQGSPRKCSRIKNPLF